MLDLDVLKVEKALKGKPGDSVTRFLSELVDGDKMWKGVTYLVNNSLQIGAVGGAIGGIIVGFKLGEFYGAKRKHKIPDALKAMEQAEAADSQNATESVSGKSDALSEQNETAPPEESA